MFAVTTVGASKVLYFIHSVIGTVKLTPHPAVGNTALTGWDPAVGLQCASSLMAAVYSPSLCIAAACHGGSCSVSSS